MIITKRWLKPSSNILKPLCGLAGLIDMSLSITSYVKVIEKTKRIKHVILGLPFALYSIKKKLALKISETLEDHEALRLHESRLASIFWYRIAFMLSDKYITEWAVLLLRYFGQAK